MCRRIVIPLTRAHISVCAANSEYIWSERVAYLKKIKTFSLRGLGGIRFPPLNPLNNHPNPLKTAAQAPRRLQAPRLLLK